MTDNDVPVGTLPAQERGERIETGKAIARGGRQTGDIPGANTQPGRPAPLSGAERYACEKTTAVGEAMGFLDDDVAPEILARRVKAASGLDVPIWEIEAIRARIRRGPAR